jgi:hypothetical protein
MKCKRCEGLMVKSLTSEPTTPGVIEEGWRCLLCGETIDACIRANRINPHPPVRSRVRQPGSRLAGFRTEKY